MASSSYSCSELKQKEEVVKVDQFGRLPKEVVMVIINKLIHAKTLLRFSMVAKRYSTLVFRTHSLLMDFTVAASTPIQPINSTYPFFNEKMSVITQRFKRIKHLHLHIRNTPRQAIPLGSGRFSQWVAVYGSRLEHVHFLAATSVHPYPNPNPNLNPNPVVDTIDEASDLYWSGVFQTTLDNVESMHHLIRVLLQQCKRVESVVFTNNTSGGGGGALFMGKHQVANLRNDKDSHRNQDRHQLRVEVFRKPNLDLPRSAYTLKDVALTKLFSATDAQVSAFASNSDPVATHSLNVLDGGMDNIVGKWQILADDARKKKHQVKVPSSTSDSVASYSLNGLGVDMDLEKWQVLLEAAHLIETENMEPTFAHTLLRSTNMG